MLPKEGKRLELVKGKKVDHAPNSSKDVFDAATGATKSVMMGREEDAEEEEIVVDETIRVNITDQI